MDGLKLNWLSRKLRRPEGWLLAPSILILIGFFVLPTLVFLVYSFLRSSSYHVEWILTLDNYIRALGSSMYWKALFNSVQIGFVVATVTTLLSYPFAYFLTYRMIKGRNLVLFLVVISVLGSYLVRVYAWRTILGREGILNTMLIGLGLIKEPLLSLLFSRLAVGINITDIIQSAKYPLRIGRGSP
jgi:spermidine/putrescine transport system permease protein